MSEDEKRELAELREKWQMDYDSSISYATKKGYEEGLLKGLADGLAEGRSKGHEEGRTEGQIEGHEQGRKEEKRCIAKKLLEKNSDVQEIIELTELTNEEILNLKNN